jgi:dCMP deaminase
MRIDRHEMMMRMAEVVAMRGTCSRLLVGAVIARDGRTISSGYNGNVSRVAHCRHVDDTPCSTAMHAEMNAIAYAARNGVATSDAYLYTTHMPCFDCSRLIINAGITKVFFKMPYRKREGVELMHLAGIDVFQFNSEFSIFQVK